MHGPSGGWSEPVDPVVVGVASAVARERVRRTAVSSSQAADGQRGQIVRTSTADEPAALRPHPLATFVPRNFGENTRRRAAHCSMQGEGRHLAAVQCGSSVVARHFGNWAVSYRRGTVTRPQTLHFFANQARFGGMVGIPVKSITDLYRPLPDGKDRCWRDGAGRLRLCIRPVHADERACWP